ncbi:MAG: rRNA pseudouridine synthase [Ruminococcaceae bacterium]|nr:rRNA pseudouridine synthase [Oscillospiraceae bacterium]
MEEIRLQKFFTDCGVLSRRAAEKEIEAGRVRVNGEVAHTGQKIDPESAKVEYAGKVIHYRPNAARHYILLHKPRGFVTTLSDEKGRQTVATLVESLGVRVYPVGRLDMDSDGLLLMTDDGALTERLTHPKHEIPKHYRVTVQGHPTPEQLERLKRPFVLDGYQTLPATVSPIGRRGGNTLLAVELYEGRNRQIRRMCEAVGLRVVQLTRVAIGRITLGDLPLGQYRHLTPQEVAYLKGNESKKGDPT